MKRPKDTDILKWVEKHGRTWGELARQAGCKEPAIETHWRRNLKTTDEGRTALKVWTESQVASVPEETPEGAFERRTSEQALKDRISSLESQLTVAAREKNLSDALRELAASTAPRLPAAPKLWTPEKLSKSSIVETPLQFYSDLHAYEVVDAERTRGHNAYDGQVMANRMAQSVAAHLGIVQRMRQGGWVFNELLVAEGGDNVSGTIHDLERHTDAPNIVLAVYGTAWVKAQVIREYARHYEKVYVFGVGGNHGRLPDARKKQMKDPTRTWDYMVYLLMCEMLRDAENVEFWFPNSWGAQVDIRGWNVLLGHGDDIKSWSGIPWYGIKRRTAQLQALEGARGNVIHYQLFGHFHAAANIPSPAGEVVVNGSCIGGTEYSIDGLGECERPKQWLLGFHEGHGMTHRWPLYLEPQEANIPEFTVTPWNAIQAAGSGDIPKWKIA